MNCLQIVWIVCRLYPYERCPHWCLVLINVVSLYVSTHISYLCKPSLELSVANNGSIPNSLWYVPYRLLPSLDWYVSSSFSAFVWFIALRFDPNYLSSQLPTFHLLYHSLFVPSFLTFCIIISHFISSRSYFTSLYYSSIFMLAFFVFMLAFFV